MCGYKRVEFVFLHARIHRHRAHAQHVLAQRTYLAAVRELGHAVAKRARLGGQHVLALAAPDVARRRRATAHLAVLRVHESLGTDAQVLAETLQVAAADEALRCHPIAAAEAATPLVIHVRPEAVGLRLRRDLRLKPQAESIAQLRVQATREPAGHVDAAGKESFLVADVRAELICARLPRSERHVVQQRKLLSHRLVELEPSTLKVVEPEQSSRLIFNVVIPTRVWQR